MKEHKKTVALIAHDGKKEEMIDLVMSNTLLLQELSLVATATTGKMIEDKSGLHIKRMSSGPMGGDLQIGAMVAEEKIDSVIFLRDPLTAHPHDPDINALMKVCDVHNIPLATNFASAKILLHFMTGNHIFKKDKRN
jgi:methylglyoxal synthase